MIIWQYKWSLILLIIITHISIISFLQELVIPYYFVTLKLSQCYSLQNSK